MTKKEITQASSQDLIIQLINFTGAETITKAEQKEFFWIVNELTSREVITDNYRFVRRLRSYLRGDCLPPQYQDIWER